MRGRIIACLFGLLPWLGGCSVTRQMEENASFEWRLWSQEQKKQRRMENEAAELLREIAQKHPHKVFTSDFREGFVDGYKDYLVYGGPIRPPAQPALKYRNAAYLTPEGHCRVRDWFLGFQYGSECAESTGRRQFYTLPILVTDQPPLPPLNITVTPPPPDGLSTDDPKKKEEAPAPKLEVPQPVTPKPVETKPEAPKASPPAAAPKQEVPKAMPNTQPIQPAPKVDVPSTPLPKVEVPKFEPAPKPPIQTSVPAPTPTLPVPLVPTVTPPPIPLIPMLPSVSLAPPLAAPAVLPASATIPVPNTP